MDHSQLLSAFSTLPQIDTTANELQLIGTKIHWSGLVGSSRSISASQVAKQAPGNHLFILEDKEQAPENMFLTLMYHLYSTIQMGFHVPY